MYSLWQDAGISPFFDRFYGELVLLDWATDHNPMTRTAAELAIERSLDTFIAPRGGVFGIETGRVKVLKGAPIFLVATYVAYHEDNWW